MYSLLIADDEPIEREAMRVMLGRLLSDRVCVVGEAENGRIAVRQAEEKQPDIVMMDIKMPGIDGIEAIREIRRKLPDAHFIMITAYDHFQYAREAMRLGVKEYILKPASKEEVVEAVERVIQEIQSERSRREAELDLKEKWMRVQPLVEAELVASLLLDRVGDISWEELSRLLQVRMNAGFSLVISLLSDMEGEESKEGIRQTYETIKDRVKQENTRCFVGPMTGMQIPVLVVWKEPLDAGGPSAKARVLSVVRQLTQALRRAVDQELFIGAGTGRSQVQELRQSYLEALMASRNPSLPAGYALYEDVSREVESDRAALLEAEKQVMEAAREGDIDQLLHRYGCYFQEVLVDAKGRLPDCRNRLMELLIVLHRGTHAPSADGTGWERLQPASTIGELRELGRQYLLELFHHVQEQRHWRLQNRLKRAKAYMREHYRDHLTLESVAEHVNLNPYYFSKLLKEECGMTFIDYLTHVRIEQAKELIESGEMSLKEICYEVGYHDPNYFSRVFKKVTGVPPSRYLHR
ncbi:response regulator [Desmospora profundinema]|uniref:Two-component system response regulator YesN n=1 Tax=Desmospora profundinema TaxID=1571184 RepID=A0ABU1IR12_9BACL|nr:response regulator [Desmospora profundinema]MDR6226863.1 two-component system response regulator YesN [Desmospora profundinema]